MNDYLKNIRKLVGSGCIYLPGVRAIILNEAGEVLLQRRTDMPLWGLPAGAVELGETALEALRREVWEETHLDVLQAESMALYSGPSQRFKYPNGDEIQCFSVAFIVRDWSGTPRADGVEGSEVRFWSLNDLPQELVTIHARTLTDFKQYQGKFLLPTETVQEGKE